MTIRRSTPAAHALALTTVVCFALSAASGPGSSGASDDWVVPIVVLTVVTLVVGWLLAWRRPAISLGWLLLGIDLLIPLQGPVTLLGTAILPAAPGVATWLLWFGENSPWSWLPPIGLLFTQVPLRFPTGRLPSPRWRWFSWATIATIVLGCALLATTGPDLGAGVANPTYVDWGAAADAMDFSGIAMLPLAALVSLASLVVRYRHGDVGERAQLRWMFWAIALVVITIPLSIVASLAVSTVGGKAVADAVTGSIVLVVGLGYSLIPLSILVAVLRHGLYSIDRIISRTAAYAIVTIVVLATYASVVLGASALLGGRSPVPVALATLAAAAVFLPVLRAVRRAVDRLFNRRQYDADRIVAAFGERLRTGADPAGAGAGLLAAVDRTLEPAAVGLWLAERRATR